MQTYRAPPSPPRPPPWTPLQRETSSQEHPRGKSPASSSMLFQQRRVRWWRPTAQMKRRPQAGPSPAGLRDENPHQGNMLVCAVLSVSTVMCYLHSVVQHLFLSCRWGRSALCTSQASTTGHSSAALSEPLEGRLPPLPEVQRHPSQRSVTFLLTDRKTKYLMQLMRMNDDCFSFKQQCHAFLTEEKKGSLQDMANQRGVACRAQGWKIHLCAAQLRQLVSAGLRPAKIQHCSVVVLSSVVLIKSWDSPWTPCNNNAVKKILSLSFFDCTSVNTMCYLICSRVWSMTCTAASPPFKRAWFLRRGQDPMMTFTESTSSYR